MSGYAQNVMPTVTMPLKRNSKLRRYLSELFSGDGNPMYGVHIFGRTYTAEGNEKVSEAVTIWAASHPGHYKEMGIRGALKAREKGLLGLPTNLKKAIEMDYTYIRG